MKLTPLDIRKQEFKRTIRGFDADEVEAFLEMVGEEYEALVRERDGLKEETTTLRTQLLDYQQIDRTLKDTLMQAQQSIHESKENNRREADLVLREAEIRAQKILEDAEIRLAEMKNELVVVKAQKDSFARRLKHLLESQLELISVLELDDLGFDQPVTSKPTRRAGVRLRPEVAPAGPAEEKKKQETAAPKARSGRQTEIVSYMDRSDEREIRVKEEEPAKREAVPCGQDGSPRDAKVSDQIIV